MKTARLRIRHEFWFGVIFVGECWNGVQNGLFMVANKGRSRESCILHRTKVENLCGYIDELEGGCCACTGGGGSRVAFSQ